LIVASLPSSEENPMTHELDQTKFREFFVHIGMISEQQAITDTKENVLVLEIWRNLTSLRRNEDTVLIEDMKVFMIAILRLNDGKIMTLEKPQEKQEEKLIGFINEDNKMQISVDESEYVRKHFDLLYTNHLQFIGKVIEA